jgi:L-lactate dehydrogenase complex protein LldF
MLPEFDRLRDQSRDIKDHTLAHLDLYLAAFEEKVEAAGGHVHWAKDAEHACTIVTGLCRKYNVGLVTKSKSMISEEIALNDALEETGIEVVETDLGEYIIQLRKEPPSHIIAPAIHLNRDQIEADFRKKHDHLPKDRVFAENADLVAEARLELRDKFLNADAGITGANFLVAQTGSVVIVTNEGNADLTQTIAPVHIVIASIEKMVPTLEDATTILRVLARSATGQDFSSYTTVTTGPKRAGDPDGPEHFHIVLLDNGRSNMLGTEFQDMLRCIRCGACMNHCPVYGAIGGHAYGWVYPGPMGAVLTPALIGIDQAGSLPNASTFCGRCEAVCPMHIELPRMMRHWREREFERHLSPNTTRYGLAAWRFVASRPKLYHILARVFAAIMKRIAGKSGRLRFLPLARGWTKYRDFPAPEGDSFQALWRKHQDKGS